MACACVKLCLSFVRDICYTADVSNVNCKTNDDNLNIVILKICFDLKQLHSSGKQSAVIYIWKPL